MNRKDFFKSAAIGIAIPALIVEKKDAPQVVPTETVSKLAGISDLDLLKELLGRGRCYNCNIERDISERINDNGWLETVGLDTMSINIDIDSNFA